MGVNPKIVFFLPPKMDGENNGKPFFLMDDLGGFTTPIFGSTPIFVLWAVLVQNLPALIHHQAWRTKGSTWSWPYHGTNRLGFLSYTLFSSKKSV